jgi:hypothetical protein
MITQLPLTPERKAILRKLADKAVIPGGKSP